MSELRRYARNLFRPWKVVTFLVAVALWWIAMPYAGDPTWDVPDMLMMCALTYLTAPWSVEQYYRVARPPRPAGLAWRIPLALLLTWLSAAGSYELYIYLKLGFRPPGWFWNMLVSIPLYLWAGMLWRYDGTLMQLLREVLSPLRRGG